MSGNGQSAVVFQQGFCAYNMKVGQVYEREINMRGTKWNIKFDFKYPDYHMEMEITLTSTDSSQFPEPVKAELTFSVPQYPTHEIVRYKGIFNNGQTTERLRMAPLRISQMYVRCELRLFPGNHSDSVVSVSRPHITVTKSDFIKSLSDFLINKKFTDVSIVVHGQEIKAHKVVLSAASPVFLALLDNNQENKIEINDIDHDTMVQVVACIYTGVAPDLENCAEKVLVTSDRFQLDWLKTECEDILMKKIDAENACDFLMKGSLYNADQLKEGAKFFITENFKDVKKTDGFRRLGESHLHLLLEILQCYDGVAVDLHEGRVEKFSVDEDANI